MQLMDGYIRMGKFRDFVPEIINLYGEEEQERICWEMWLHKCLDKSYTDFRESIMAGSNQPITKEEQTAITRHSFDVLRHFEPCEQQGA